MGNVREATLLFEINTEAFPESSSAFVDLGAARLAAGQIRSAVENYGRALELDPENQAVAGLLDRIRKDPAPG